MSGQPAHTTNDSIIWLPERSVLFSGDLVFNGGTPFLLMGSVEGAIDALEKVVEPLAAATIVPGHGPVCGPRGHRVHTDIPGVRDRPRPPWQGSGRHPAQAARDTDLGPFADWLDPERIVGNLHRAYAELDGLPRGGRIDIIAALTDMVDYNNGRPLTCWA